jgi:hypothetical protein
MLPQVEENVWDFYLSIKNIAHTHSTFVGIFSLLIFLQVPLVSYERHFIVLGIPRRAYTRFIIGCYLFTSTNLWASIHFFRLNKGQSPLGSIHLKIPKYEEVRGLSVESGNYDQE